jgi:Family of unknown function (DUF6518)
MGRRLDGTLAQMAFRSSPGVAPAPFASRRVRVLLVVIVGLAVGCLTSVGQTYLNGALNPFVNSASAWLVAPFALGACMATRRGAPAAGFSVCTLQLVGYYVTAQVRGFPASHAIVAFWAACALLGGPIFGVAGHLWRTGRRSTRGLGGAVLPAAFLAEGLWVYVHELHYYWSAAVWLSIGLVLALALGRGLVERRWLALTVPLGLVAEVLLSQIYAQRF